MLDAPRPKAPKPSSSLRLSEVTLGNCTCTASGNGGQGLVLVGGKTGAEVEGHDWEYLLTELGWLRFDRSLGLGAHRLGLTMMGGAPLGRNPSREGPRTAAGASGGPVR